LSNRSETEIGIIGGGLAGLFSAIVLAKKGHQVALFEKKEYPFHRVCGEYISTEVSPLLEHLGLFPHQFKPSQISRVMISSSLGSTLKSPLAMGGFGISRYSLDQYWAHIAQELGVQLFTGISVENYQFEKDNFQLQLSGEKTFSVRTLIAAYGKRSKLDLLKNRSFTTKRSPYVGVKYHIRMPFPADLIALHNFPGGYCGLSAIEDGKLNLCYLAGREGLRAAGNIEQFEHRVLQQNPYLKEVWEKAEFLFEKPEVINEISFAPRSPVEDHALMVGDTAGLITPLCGNGMAIAIHSAWLAANLSSKHLKGELNREALEQQYAREWGKRFSTRLMAGRNLQKLFGERFTTDLAIRLFGAMPVLTRKLISLTHGKTLDPCASI
jgi:menaquinone-9 beta-reductase